MRAFSHWYEYPRWRALGLLVSGVRGRGARAWASHRTLRVSAPQPGALHGWRGFFGIDDQATNKNKSNKGGKANTENHKNCGVQQLSNRFNRTALA